MLAKKNRHLPTARVTGMRNPRLLLESPFRAAVAAADPQVGIKAHLSPTAEW
jgi:hypothetical protein